MKHRLPLTFKDKSGGGGVHVLHEDFQYRHANPYDEKLRDYSQFVLRDRQTEQFRGKWNHDVFRNNRPIHLEIGTGYGYFMRSYCQQNPSINFIGLDYRFKRSFNLAQRIHRDGLTNIRYLRAMAERLHFILGREEVDNIFLFFPDPWEKRKHHKKRLFTPLFLNTLHQILKPQGKVFIKTDHDDYAYSMISHFKNDPRWLIELRTTDLHRQYPDHFLTTHITKFETIFLSKKIPIKAFILQKLAAHTSYPVEGVDPLLEKM